MHVALRLRVSLAHPLVCLHSADSEPADSEVSEPARNLVVDHDHGVNPKPKADAKPKNGGGPSQDRSRQALGWASLS